MGNCFKFKKADSVITFARSFGHREYNYTNKDNDPAYVSKKIKQFFTYYNPKHITDIPHNPTEQAVIKSNSKGYVK